MNYILIKNKGVLDINGLNLMGVSTKREEEKIGFFGSGNKYALAYLLRNNLKFWIYSGLQLINITTKPILFRGQTFEQIIIHGKETSLTTAMGPDWEKWYPIREFYANAMDEGEATISIVDKIVPKSDETHIYLSYEDFRDIVSNFNKYIIQVKPLIKSEKISIYTHGQLGTAYLNIYRKGINVTPKTHNKIQSLFCYDFEELNINESRVYTSDFDVRWDISRSLAKVDNHETIMKIILASRNMFEHDLPWNSISEWSETWESIVRSERIVSASYPFLEHVPDAIVISHNLAQGLSNIEDHKIVGMSNNEEEMFVEVATKDKYKSKIDKTVKTLKTIGIDVTEVPIKICQFSRSDIVGMYKNNNIMLSEKYLETATDTQMEVLVLEEYYHSLGYYDYSRKFQDFLLEQIIALKHKVTSMQKDIAVNI